MYLEHNKMYLDISTCEIIGRSFDQVMVKFHGETANILWGEKTYTINHQILYWAMNSQSWQTVSALIDKTHTHHRYYILQLSMRCGEIPNLDNIDKCGYHDGSLILLLNEKQINNNHKTYYMQK